MARNKYNAAGPFVDLVKKLNTSLGAVRDLHGNVYAPVNQAIGQSTKRGWYFIKVPHEGIVSLAEIYEAASVSTDIGFLPMDSDGNADLTSISDNVGFKEAILLIAGIQVQVPTRLSLSVDAGGTNLYAFMNNTKLAEGSNSISAKSIALQSGVVNVLQLVVARKKPSGLISANFFTGTISISSEAPIIVNLPPPDYPTWDLTAPIIYGSLDADIPANGLILTWNKSPFAGGWYIEKTSYESLGEIVSYVASGTTGFDFVTSGTYAPSVNSQVIIEEEFIGVVTDYTGLAGNQTSINVFSAKAEVLTWPTKKLFGHKETTVIAEIDKRNTNQNDLTTRFLDTTVVENLPYTYRIFAWGAFDKSTLSQASAPVTKLAFDNTPPGPIVLYPNSADAVSTRGDLVTVQHIYPSDPDLAGYRIYKNSGVSLVTDLRIGNEFMLLDAPPPEGADPIPSNYGIFKFRVSEVEGFDVQHIVSGYLVTTYDYAGNELPIASGTYIDITLLVDLVANFTAFDNVSSPTRGQRRPPEIPDHLWRTAIDILEAGMQKAGYK